MIQYLCVLAFFNFSEISTNENFSNLPVLTQSFFDIWLQTDLFFSE